MTGATQTGHLEINVLSSVDNCSVAVLCSSVMVVPGIRAGRQQQQAAAAAATTISQFFSRYLRVPDTSGSAASS
jgi:hypothetical protein